MRLARYEINRYRPAPYAIILGERWNEDFQKRVETYHLRDKRIEPKTEPEKPSKELSPQEKSQRLGDSFQKAIAEGGVDLGMYDPSTGLLAGSPRPPIDVCKI